MKQLSKALLVTALIGSANPTLAGYDEFDCRSNGSIKNAGLECVTCGLQKHYRDQGLDEVKVSEKWLTLMGILAQREYSQNTVRSPEEREAFQKAVIRNLQIYGFCSEYLGKETKGHGRSQNYKDMSAEDWRYFNSLLNRDYKISDDQLADAAAKLGFKSGLFSNKSAKKNLEYLFEGNYENLSLDQKRDLFKQKLKQALAPNYDISGEKISKEFEEFIADGDKDQGLRSCLADIKERFFEKTLSDKATHGLCVTMAEACDLPRKHLDSNGDFCIHPGMALKPASRQVQPPPFGNGTRPIPPPPPRPAGKSGGVK